ncbi:MAG: OmpA family protein, partial [Rhodospirillales bacterium]|nr:OmpA family protein [Rhodospirillales bacterium]
PKPPAPAALPKPPAPPQQAARPPGPAAAPLRSVAFAPGNADLSGDSRKALDTLAASLTADPNLRMQLLAYAGEPNLSASQSRRLSLSRALAVRSYLISKGIRSTRIDVRALGNKVPSGTPNRVDLRTISR